MVNEPPLTMIGGLVTGGTLEAARRPIPTRQMTSTSMTARSFDMFDSFDIDIFSPLTVST
jgi:hypothetical protein